MRVVRNMIVWSFLIGAPLLAEAFPFSGTRMETNSINQDPNGHELPRWIIDEYERQKMRAFKDLEAAESTGDAIDDRNLDDIEKNGLDNFGNEGEFPAHEFLRDAELDKRAIRKQKFKYYRCYFNPVTCYRR